MRSRRSAAVEARLAGPLRDYRFRQWDRDGGPSAPLRWSMAHPVVVTVGVALLLGVLFGATFGVPPLSPFVLVALLCAPILPWLRSQHRLYVQWRDRAQATGREAS